MPNVVTWKGSTTIVEQPGSPIIEEDASGVRVTRTFRGPTAALRAGKPAIGSIMSGYAGIPVERVRIVPDGAGETGPGTMTVLLGNDAGDGEEIETITDITYEVEEAQIEKKLESHPRYQAGGAAPLVDADYDAIAQWRSAQSAADRSTAYDAASANAKDFINKLRRGQESYLVFAPVARKTTRAYTALPAGKTGAVATPLGFGTQLPADYTWLKTAARSVRQGARGKWELVEEWTGADSWDPQIYLEV